MASDDTSSKLDHTQYKEEVEQRWGAQTYADSDRWWRGLDNNGKQAFLDEGNAITEAWHNLRRADVDAEDPQAQKVAARHVAWIRAGWAGRQPTPEALAELAQMYVDDERFAANYGGVEGATYVRDALVVFSRTT